MSTYPSNHRDDKHDEPVNPAGRTNDEADGEVIEHADDSQRESMHNQQAAQNQDHNNEYDPTQGKRPDQLRRNDKRGQMGG
ncbi:MAG: hypothetical protein ABIW79_06240 [Gemmatimonas sp.]